MSAEERWRPLLRLLGYYGAESVRGRRAEAILKSCAVQAYHSSWTTHGKVLEEFRPRHMLIMTHVWMVHRRLHDFPKRDLSEAKLLQEAMFDELWEDTTIRIRQENVPELTVDKHLRDVQKYSFAGAVEYDQALITDDHVDALAAAVWRNIFLADHLLTVDHCTKVAQYILQNKAIVDAMPPSDVLDAKFDLTTPRF